MYYVFIQAFLIGNARIEYVIVKKSGHLIGPWLIFLKAKLITLSIT